jgi:hypothetical protein
LPVEASPIDGDPTVKIFDTGKPSPRPLEARDFSTPSKWTRIAEDQTDHTLGGDLVLVNDRLAVVLRPGAPGVEVHGRGDGTFPRRAVLQPACEDGSVRLRSVAIKANAATEAVVEAGFRGADDKIHTILLALGVGQAFVRTEASQGVKSLAVQAACRFLTLPDFFADDIVVDAADLPVDTAELPSENFLLQMAGQGDAIVMAVSNSREQDVTVRLSGSGENRTIDQSEIRYGADGKIWIALLEAPGIWHQRNVEPGGTGRVVALDWKAPYPAQWRVDWRRSDRLTGSWEMISELSDGRFEKQGWFGYPQTIPADRKRWTTVLGRFEYPCWTDHEGRGYLQPFTQKVRFEGPAVIYPINRTDKTPLDRFTVVDVVRATLGVGPCEYILDVEGQGQSYVGRATCATRDLLDPIYAAGRQKQERAKIEQALVDVVVFVKHIRARVETYVDFGHQIRDYLAQEKKTRPELAQFLDEMDTLAGAFDDRYEKRRAEIKTPQYVVDLTEKFRREVLSYQGDDALAKCKAITAAIVVVGGNQDELVGECRMAAKILRQRAGLAMAIDPSTAPVARELRRRTQDILRNPASYEAPRH